MAQAETDVAKLNKKCDQLSKENLELRQEQENHAIEIQERDAQISELNGVVQLLRRGAASYVDSERRLALEKATLLAANRNQSLELKDKVAKIRQLDAELKKTYLNGDEMKGQLTSLRSKVTAANERIRQLETEDAKLKADLNIANQRTRQLETEDAKLKADLIVANKRFRQLKTVDAKLKAALNAANKRILQLEPENEESEGDLNAERPNEWTLRVMAV